MEVNIGVSYSAKSVLTIINSFYFSLSSCKVHKNFFLRFHLFIKFSSMFNMIKVKKSCENWKESKAGVLLGGCVFFLH